MINVASLFSSQELFIFLVRGEKFFPAKEAASFMNKNELFFCCFYRKVEKGSFSLIF